MRVFFNTEILNARATHFKIAQEITWMHNTY